MIELMDTQSGLVGFRASGTVAAADVQQVTAAVDVELERNSEVSMLADLTRIEGITADGMLRDIAEGLKRAQQLDRFERVAIVSDAGWARAAAQVENALLPGITVQRFDSSDHDAARAWAAGG